MPIKIENGKYSSVEFHFYGSCSFTSMACHIYIHVTMITTPTLYCICINVKKDASVYSFRKYETTAVLVYTPINVLNKDDIRENKIITK